MQVSAKNQAVFRISCVVPLRLRFSPSSLMRILASSSKMPELYTAVVI